MTEGGSADRGALISRRVTISNARGLHARAAARFVRLAESFDADITVLCKGQSVSGVSIMGLMMLAAAPGTELQIIATGVAAKSAADALVALVEARFEED